MKKKFYVIKINLITKLIRVFRKLGLFNEKNVHYIGGNDVLPPPLSVEEDIG
jgi:hypothetical protein